MSSVFWHKTIFAHFKTQKHIKKIVIFREAAYYSLKYTEINTPP